MYITLFFFIICIFMGKGNMYAGAREQPEDIRDINSSLPTMWVLGIELRSSDLEASTFTLCHFKQNILIYFSFSGLGMGSLHMLSKCSPMSHHWIPWILRAKVEVCYRVMGLPAAATKMFIHSYKHASQVLLYV